jgi:biopolymer transport protein ExbB/TolQ
MVVGLWPVLLTGVYAINKRREKIEKEEKELAVVKALEKAEEEAKTKLSQAMEKAENDKKKAIESAVKKALEEAAAKQEPEDSGDKEA